MGGFGAQSPGRIDIRVIKGFTNRIVGHDADDQILFTVIDDLVRFAGS